ncbi:hypothetical protein TCAL_04943 [Tigriopus californicus]|uniref:Uncharacterized protein n=2 Tax=Tigriopus californicus TaxID=6832 RepID=A0A553PBE3_TIGCA|nr:hypothetical protein TCAL_04943 [Tigriopus californicus]|eukprot:TCALIF_04943-PA protein Name:"Protein of unknown function" AED:0.05 eAED:0.05 QI:53/1/0.66/1/1/1/3/81/207
MEAANGIDVRIAKVLEALELKILVAIDSIEKDITIANRDRVILGLSNFLGMVFGVFNGASGNPNLGELTLAEQIQVTAQLMYGYGYWGPFLLEFEPARLDCDRSDLEEALSEFAFLTDMAHNFGYLNDYAGTRPKEQLPDTSDPVVLQYYTVELNHAIKRNLYCIIKRAGSNQDALEVTTFVDLYTMLITERLTMTDVALQESANFV